jgi:hypothetical protein
MGKRIPGNGIVVYRDRNIMAVLTGLEHPSHNRKTGDMLQLWIICQEHDPVTSRRLGLDRYICGSCPLSGHGCYVVLYQAPQTVWNRYKAEPVRPVPARLRTSVRIGAYGDGAFLPAALLDKLSAKAGHTSYTHQWLTGPESLADHSMASIDNLTANRLGITSSELKQLAKAKGFRTYRILGKSDTLDDDETLCPHFTHGIQCAHCLLCDGNKGRSRTNIAVPATGAARAALA